MSATGAEWGSSMTIGSPLQRFFIWSLSMPSCWICSWSITIAWSRASGRGGQPGT